MGYSRRTLLKTTGLAVASAGLAGCSSQSEESTATTTQSTEDAETTDAESSVTVDATTAVAAEWNAMRARLYDSVALATAGRLGTAGRVAEDVFARFEQSSGEWGAHEQLEATNEQNYETFEEHLGAAATALSDGHADEGIDLAMQASDNLLAAQRGRVDPAVVDALGLYTFASRARDVEMLAAAGEAAAAAELAHSVYESFEDAPAHEVIEDASSELYETFEAGIEGAAEANDASTIQQSSRNAATAMVDASYEVAPKSVAGAGHLALMQSVGFDAEVLAGLGGPGDEYAHAAALTLYRARAADVAWLVAQGQTDFAATLAGDIYAHFEGARAHEALEHADHDAYEGFEGGLESLKEAAESGDLAATEDALQTVDDNLLIGVSALTGGDSATLFEAAFFRARLADARELVALGATDRAASVAEGLFARFEENEGNLHEAIEHESEDLYHRFEEEHLEGLVDATKAGDSESAVTHAQGAMDALFEFETAVGTTAEVSAAEAAFFGARGFDAAGLAQVGATDRAAAVVQETFSFFEEGAGGYHEALEHADHDLYESFEGALGGIRMAAEEDGDAYGAAKTYNQQSIDSMYAVVATAAADAGLSATASEHMSGVFETFEGARVHETLEESDHEAYEGFEEALSTYVDALDEGADVDTSANAYAASTLRAQFAVVGAADEAPIDHSSHDHSHGDGETKLTGGPNVVEGVPEDADHVVKLTAVAFEPEELTVTVGDTVAFEHTAGEAHTATASESGLPKGAAYWASGGFESQEAAEAGWDDGEGAVQSGQSYVHTFETAGEHAYLCIPHEAAGMTGTVVVEE
ncbi:DUF5059 domain-containing protein [Haloferax sp. MBLA0076]|uniref:DUF5059 domain-containing protein n=1 Tax=Haloferax litoreum TaxID=2666140 RepID=A0A6A8GMW5_9EURY|nr:MULTISPECIES: DUF5059 domain-containing protein [Haloferax]KAB1194546.1 DUF5059 domain-containing protein [Haloferax sp. CBA1148]MRX23120.1 DUF5059 domain-containing protein [Haloferax litoreum]